jgi:hypothetical protein
MGAKTSASQSTVASAHADLGSVVAIVGILRQALAAGLDDEGEQ